MEHGELKVFPDDAGRTVWVKEYTGDGTRAATLEELQTAVNESGYVTRARSSEYQPGDTWDSATGNIRFHTFRVTKTA